MVFASRAMPFRLIKSIRRNPKAIESGRGVCAGLVGFRGARICGKLDPKTCASMAHLEIDIHPNPCAIIASFARCVNHERTGGNSHRRVDRKPTRSNTLRRRMDDRPIIDSFCHLRAGKAEGGDRKNNGHENKNVQLHDQSPFHASTLRATTHSALGGNALRGERGQLERQSWKGSAGRLKRPLNREGL